MSAPPCPGSRPRTRDGWKDRKRQWCHWAQVYCPFNDFGCDPLTGKPRANAA